MSDPYSKLLNEIIKAMLPEANSYIDSAIRSGGFDPLQKVISDSKSFGIGKASYSVTDLTGLSSLEIQSMEVSNVTGNPPNLSGDATIHLVLNSDLAANIEGDVKIKFPPADPGISGSITVNGCTVSGDGIFKATVDSSQICLTQVNVTSADFNYSSADAKINGPKIINVIIKPLENLILDAVKGDIRSLVSGQLKSIVNSEISNLLPLCQSL
jgi:hypothetical protein